MSKANIVESNGKKEIEPAEFNFEVYKEKLFKAGMRPEMFDPKKIKHSDIIAAERVSVEKQKLKTQQDAMKLALVKFMRGNAEEGDVIDGRDNREGIVKENPA